MKKPVLRNPNAYDEEDVVNIYQYNGIVLDPGAGHNLSNHERIGVILVNLPLLLRELMHQTLGLHNCTIEKIPSSIFTLLLMNSTLEYFEVSHGRVRFPNKS